MAFFPSPFFGLLTFPFILACTPHPTSTCRFGFPGLILVPSAHTQSGLGVVVKAKEYGPVRCRVFNGSNDSFPFVLCRHTVQGSFFYQRRYFRFSQNCSFTVLALPFRRASGMPRTESSSAMYQGYLDFYYVSSVISHLGSGLGS